MDTEKKMLFMCVYGRVGNRGLGLKEEEVRAVRGKAGDEGADILIARGAGKDSCQIVKHRAVQGPSDREEERRGTKHSSLL